VESAASDFESALCDHRRHCDSSPPDDDDGGFAERGEDDIVDFLVALLTSVPRTLLRRADFSADEVRDDPRRELNYHSSMERICFNFACISSDVIRKHLRVSHPALEDRHVYDMIDEVVQICNGDTSARAVSNLDPILTLLNSLSEGHDLERAMYECDKGGDGDGDGCRTIFSHLSSTESLRLVHILMHHFVCDRDGQCVESSGHIGSFIGYLLKHFANVVREEMGCDSFDECTADLFESWAQGVDEHKVRRLSDDETKGVHSLIVRYHVVSIQSALHLMENSESVICGNITESERNGGVIEGAPESIVVALKDVVRHMTMVVGTAEAMDKLCLEHNPEIHVIFFPLLSSYARFAVSCFHDALHFLRSACDSTHDVENVMILADDLLFRLCHVTIGLEALKSPSYCEGDDVLALSLLRAVTSQCITGRARFLLEIAADRAQVADRGVATRTGEPIPKRQRRESMFGAGRLPEEGWGDMSDVVLACLALSQSDRDHEHPDSSSAKRVSCISSALMFSRKDAPGDKTWYPTVVDPLNPWHTIQVKPLQRSASFCDDGNNPYDTSLAYAHATPHLLDTKSSAFSRQI
jgi:hypothetical protein